MSLSLSNYNTEFTQENQQILKDVGLYNVELINTTDNGTSVNIEWTQIARCLTGCEEKYKECLYKIDGKDAHVKVFVAEECGNPPDKINTSGCQLEEGKLHFGYVYWDEDKKSASVFFVIHPNAWEPFQHRFHTNNLLKFGQDAAAEVATTAGAAIGSAVPIIGTTAGATIGRTAGFIVKKVSSSLIGDYLRYIG